MYSFRIEQAIRAASILHQDQLRKGAVPLPYITHLMAVSLILLDYTDNEEVIIAALLHDTLEDTDYTFEELHDDFGYPVAELVLTLTEPKDKDGTKLTWKERKKTYALQLKKGSDDAILIAAADKIHNFRTTVEEYYDDHVRFLQDFGKNLADRAEVYQDMSNVINARLKSDIVHEFNHVFTEYKNFLIDVETSISKTV